MINIYFKNISIIFLAFLIVISGCTIPNNTPTDKPKFDNNRFIKDLNELNKNLLSGSNKTELKNFKIKSTSFKTKGITRLPLPFECSTYSCNGLSPVIQTQSTLSYSDGRSEDFTQVGAISISPDGKAALGAGYAGGGLYGGGGVTIVGTVSPSNYLTDTKNLTVDVSGQPCGAGYGSYRTHDSSAILSPTYFIRSANASISIQGRDLVATASGITSDTSAFWMAPWDGSCRIANRTDSITSGNISVTIKDVVPLPDTIEGSIESDTIGTENGLAKTDILITPTNLSKPWTFKITGDNNGCTYSKEYNKSGSETISFPDGVDVKSLDGNYNVEVYYSDTPEDKATSSVTVKNKVLLTVDPQAIDKSNDLTTDDSVNIKIEAPSCPDWKLNITGTTIDRVNGFANPIPGTQCTIAFPQEGQGKGDSQMNFDGTCNGEYYKDNVTATLTSKNGSDTKTISVKIPQTKCKVDEDYFPEFNSCCPKGSGCQGATPSPSSTPTTNPTNDPSTPPTPSSLPTPTAIDITPNPSGTPTNNPSNTPGPTSYPSPSNSSNPKPTKRPTSTPSPTSTPTARIEAFTMVLPEGENENLLSEIEKSEKIAFNQATALAKNDKPFATAANSTPEDTVIFGAFTIFKNLMTTKQSSVKYELGLGKEANLKLFVFVYSNVKSEVTVEGNAIVTSSALHKTVTLKPFKVTYEVFPGKNNLTIEPKWYGRIEPKKQFTDDELAGPYFTSIGKHFLRANVKVEHEDKTIIDVDNSRAHLLKEFGVESKYPDYELNGLLKEPRLDHIKERHMINYLTDSQYEVISNKINQYALDIKATFDSLKTNVRKRDKQLELLYNNLRAYVVNDDPYTTSVFTPKSLDCFPKTYTSDQIYKVVKSVANFNDINDNWSNFSTSNDKPRAYITGTRDSLKLIARIDNKTYGGYGTVSTAYPDLTGLTGSQQREIVMLHYLNIVTSGTYVNDPNYLETRFFPVTVNLKNLTKN